jgi:transcriptional regulator with XRE-family HTH domain
MVMTVIDWELMTLVIRDWAAYNGIDPNEFAERLGYSYQHAWNVLRGKGEVRDETLGKIALGFDAEALQDILGEYSLRVDSGKLAANQ